MAAHGAPSSAPPCSNPALVTPFHRPYGTQQPTWNAVVCAHPGCSGVCRLAVTSSPSFSSCPATSGVSPGCARSTTAPGENLEVSVTQYSGTPAARAASAMRYVPTCWLARWAGRRAIAPQQSLKWAGQRRHSFVKGLLASRQSAEEAEWGGQEGRTEHAADWLR